jgi:hypothetical protein
MILKDAEPIPQGGHKRSNGGLNVPSDVTTSAKS